MYIYSERSKISDFLFQYCLETTNFFVGETTKETTYVGFEDIANLEDNTIISELKFN